MTALLVATSGGHLRQLHELRARLPGATEAVWFTFDTPQSRSLLDGEAVVYGEPTPPRSVLGTSRNALTATRIIRANDFDIAFSTGATLAVSTLPVAAAFGIESHYIESATRVTGPSLSGRILRVVPGVRTYSQYRSWSRRGWHYGGSIFDGFAVEDSGSRRPRTILVTLGTTQDFPFKSLVAAMQRITPTGTEVIWQSGSRELDGIEANTLGQIPSAEFDALLRDVDAVVGHAGTGTSIAALRAGKLPVLVPRRMARDEHVDDHQVEIAVELERQGLALHREVDDLTWADVEEAAANRVVPSTAPPSFDLVR